MVLRMGGTLLRGVTPVTFVRPTKTTVQKPKSALAILWTTVSEIIYKILFPIFYITVASISAPLQLAAGQAISNSRRTILGWPWKAMEMV